MTRTTNARIAGFTFLFYFAAGITDMAVFGRATDAEGTAAKLARIAEHAPDVRISILLGLLQCFSAVALAVTLYAITRDEDRDLALLALCCRAGEGMFNAIASTRTVALLWLATAAAGPGAPDAVTSVGIGGYLFGLQGPSAIFFAVGSTLFAYLLLRGRMIPVPLAWLGVVASALAVIALPLEFVGLIRGAILWAIWLPLAAFEVPLALWLLVKGVPAPRIR